MKLFGNKKRKLVEIVKQYEATGVRFSVVKEGVHVELPLQFTIREMKQIDNMEALITFEDLVLDDFFEKDGTSYIMDYTRIYDLDPEKRNFLALPSEKADLKMEVDSEGFVGSPRFSLNIKYGTADQPNLHRVAERKGPVIFLPGGKELLLQRELYELMELVDQPLPSRDNQALFYRIAEVKKAAEQSGVPVSEHLQRENYEFIEELDLNVTRSEEGISVFPSFKNANLDEETLSDSSLTETGYAQKSDKRVFVRNETKQHAQSVKQMNPINGEDIPRFVQNPEAFLPEDVPFSKELFGDRVRDLGIRVYKASPFIHANSSDRGWFEFDAGYHVKDDEGNTISHEEEDFFGTKGEGSFKQMDEVTFIAVPEQTEEFQKYAQKLKQTKKNDPNANAYVLEIFENLQQVEYNQPLQEMRESLQDEKVFDRVPPPGFLATLHPFQEDGFVWMKSLRFSGYGGLLADDMGLGKTIQVIAYLTYLKEQKRLRPALLVLPKTLIENWLNEISKFAPELAASYYEHLGPERLEDPEDIAQFDIVLTTYQTMVRDQIKLGQVDWEIVIADEAQHIKNPSTSASIVLKALKNKGRIALTGTPVENNLSELWSIVDYVQPGLLGSLNEFKEQYEKPLANEETDYGEIQSRIEERLRFVYKRRTKLNQLKGQLPDKLEHHGKHLSPLGRLQRHIYEEILNLIKTKEMVAIEGLQKLKMLCSHPGLIDPSLKSIKVKEVPKLEQTLNLLKEIRSKGEKALIFTEYLKMQAILKQTIAEEFNLNPLIINGASTSRQAMVDQFNAHEGFDVLILSPKAAGTGLTITGANHVIHYTRWWNPAVENQATDRAYRIGQTKDVHVYYPTVTSQSGTTVEVIVDQLLKEKKTLAENIIVPSKDLDTKEIISRMTSS